MTFSNLITKVAAYLHRTDLNTLIPDLINMAMFKLERENNWKCMEVRARTVTNEETLALPTNYKTAKWLAIVSSGKYYFLKKKTLSQILKEYPENSATARPLTYATLNGSSEILVRPFPDASYTYEFCYFKRSIDLVVTTNETNWWTLNAWDILLYGALLEASPYLKDDARVALWGQAFEMAFKSIKKAEIEEESDGSLQNLEADYLV